MKVILGLRGKGSIGKSTTLTLLRNRLPQVLEGFVEILHRPHGLVVQDSYFVFKNEISQKRIGVSTPGDNENEVREGLQNLLDNGCEICLTACRGSGGTNTAIEEIPDFVSLYFPKKIGIGEVDQAALNHVDAEDLLRVVQNFL